MIRRILGLFSAVLLCGIEASAEPRLFPLPGLPEAMVPFRYAVNEENGLLVVSTMGVAVPRGSAWRYVPSPSEGVILSAVEHPLGLVAGIGNGGMLFDGQAWRKLPIDGLPAGRVHRRGDAVFLATSTGVYRVDASGRSQRVLDFPQPVVMALLYEAGDELVVLTQHPQAVYIGNGSTFRASPENEHLVRENGPVLFLSMEGRSTGFFFDGEKCYPQAPAGVSESVLRRICATYKPITPFTRPVLGNGYFYGVSRQGVECYSLADGSQRMVITNEMLGSEVSSLAWGPEGLIVVAASRVFTMPDHDYVAYAKNPPSGVFYQRIDTPQGRLVLNLNGPHYEDGRPASDLPTHRPLAGLMTSARDLVLADMEAVYWGKRKIPVPELVNGVAAMLTLSAERVLVILPQGLIAVDIQGRVHRAPFASSKVDYLARIDDQQVLAVTRGEALILASEDLRELRRFGRGVAGLLQDGRPELTRIVTMDGRWYTTSGEIAFRRPWPFRTMLAWLSVRGRDVAFGILPDGRRMAAYVDRKTGDIQPLDLPMHAAALNLEIDDDRLAVIFPAEKMTLQTPPRVLSQPNANASLWCDGRRLETEAELPTDSPDVELRMPRARVVPWTNPIYRVQIGEGTWQEVAAGAVVPVPRLGFGLTTVRVRVLDGTLESEAELSVRRRWPWWARWPGWTLGTGALLGLAYGLSVLRVRQIGRRNRELEGLVAERTHELEIARRKSEEASAVKGEFIASINHEIRNPMNGIIGLVRILREYDAGARWQVLLGTLEACAEQLRASLDDVLDFNQIERGQITLQAGAFDWGRLLHSCRAALDADGTTIILEVPAAPLAVTGDAGKVRQIVTNFLSNALKYGEPPGALLRLRLESAEEGNHRAVVEVVSRGRTLSEAERGQLFSLFYRGSRARETSAPGTGLGLALCRRFAEAMGGKVGVKPVPEGNLFWLELALPVAAEAEPETGAKPITDLRGRLVLAIEDENYNRLVLDYYLKRQGIRADWGATAADAVELIKSARPYQAVLTDWFLPDADGTRLLQLLRQARGGDLPPVIAMTAYATQEKRAEILAAGVTAFVSKPVDDRKLAATLQAVLGGTPQIEDLDEASDDANAGAPSAGNSLRIDRLQALGDPTVVIGHFVQDFGDAWAKIVRTWREQPQTAAAEAHRLRTQALLVEAKELSRQLGLLELALGDSQRAADAEPLVDEIEREVTRVLAGVTALTQLD